MSKLPGLAGISDVPVLRKHKSCCTMEGICIAPAATVTVNQDVIIAVVLASIVGGELTATGAGVS